MMPTTELSSWLQATELPAIAAILPSGRSVEIPRLLRSEVRLPDPILQVSSCWAPNKPTLDFGGQATWAEFVIVRLLEQQGWSGRWIKNWGGREFCLMVGRTEPIPKAAADTFHRIDRRAASITGGGAWDVFAWRDSDYLIIESKQHRSGDRLRPGQLAWLEAALDEGIKRFGVVEYDAGLATRLIAGTAPARP